MTEDVRISRVSLMRNLVLVSLTAGIPRIIGALFLKKEPFGDAYCYIEQVALIRGKILAGSFAVTDLFGFWLPLYQVICSIISLAVNQPVYVAKLVSALAGVGVCVLVYLCSQLLTGSQRAALLASLAIALNPFHLQYSSAAMTDIPHALMVMLCMYFVLTERWTLAACFGAAAGLIRLDSWMLILLVPAIQFMRERKIPIMTTLILALAPALWLFVCWAATGDPLASFHAHDQYVASRLSAHPEFNQITFQRTWFDGYRLVYAVNVAVLAGCLMALWLIFRSWRSAASKSEPAKIADPLVCVLFFFAYFGFILLAYFTKNQSDIWPRYGLIMFSLGLPALAYSAHQVFTGRSVLAQALLLLALVCGVVQYRTQAIHLSQFEKGEERARTIANYLKQQYAADQSIRIFCDDTAVRVISEIPRAQFYDSFAAPRNREGFVGFLRANGVRFMVVPPEAETSTPGQLFPNLVNDSGDAFEAVMTSPPERREDSLYRVRTKEASPPV